MLQRYTTNIEYEMDAHIRSGFVHTTARRWPSSTFITWYGFPVGVKLHRASINSLRSNLLELLYSAECFFQQIAVLQQGFV